MIGQPGGWRQAVADNGVPLTLAAIAFGGSFAHWVHLASTHGQHGPLAPATAVCVDLGVLMATRERQHDLRTGRKRRGWASWPTLVMVGGIALTLAGNVASAQVSAWGIVTALIPGAFLLLAISLMERRAAEAARRHAAAERQRLADEAAGRQRLADLAAERERQEAARLEAEAVTRRRAERQAELAARHAQIVTPASVTVTSGPPRLVLAAGPETPSGAGPAGSATSATAVMRAHWDAEVAAGRTPTGADLLRAAGVPPTSSFGRQLAARWRRELEGATA